MTIGAPVVVTYSKSHFFGRRGVVVSVNPIMVQLEGEPEPLLFGAESIAPASSPGSHMVAGE